MRQLDSSLSAVRWILNRIQQPIDVTLRRQQAAYREGRSALDHIATLRIIIEQMNESAGSLYLVFLQYEKECNRLCHTYLWSALRRKGVPDKIVNLLAARYNTFSYRVRYNGLLSKPIRLEAGLIRGCPLSPLLFLVVIDEIMIGAIDREPKRGLPWVEKQHLNDLSFAHDIVLLSTRRTNMASKLGDLMEYSTAAGLTVNVSKTSAMDVSTSKPSSFRLAGQPIKKTVSFQYRGTLLTADGDVSFDVAARIQEARAAFNSLKKIWPAEQITRETKLKLFNSTVKPLLLRGCETWCGSAKTCKQLQEFISRCLRRIVSEDRISDEELLQQCHQMPMERELRVRKWRWIVKTLCKSDSEVCKQVLDWYPPETGHVGRPSTTWRRSVVSELAKFDKVLTWSDVKGRAANRVRWELFCRRYVKLGELVVVPDVAAPWN